MTDQKTLLHQARQMCRRKAYPAAYAIYERLLHSKPGDPHVLCEYGKAKYFAHKEDDAAQLFEQALTVEPDSIETLLWLADVYSAGYGQGYDAAVALYRRIIQLDPRNIEAYIGLGMSHFHPGAAVTLDEAIAAYRTVTQLDPQRIDGHLNLGQALAEVGESLAAQEELRITVALLTKAGLPREAQAIQRKVDTLERGGPLASTIYRNETSRYDWLEQE